MMSATSAPHRRWSSRSLGSQPSLQAFVRFSSHRIMPAGDPIVALTRCTTSAPSSPLATGSTASMGKRARSISSRSASRASPWACCEPCAALRLSSSIVRLMDLIVWSFSTTFNRAASSGSWPWAATGLGPLSSPSLHWIFRRRGSNITAGCRLRAVHPYDVGLCLPCAEAKRHDLSIVHECASRCFVAPALVLASSAQAVDIWTVGVDNTRQGWNRSETVLNGRERAQAEEDSRLHG